MAPEHQGLWELRNITLGPTPRDHDRVPGWPEKRQVSFNLPWWCLVGSLVKNSRVAGGRGKGWDYRAWQLDTRPLPGLLHLICSGRVGKASGP